MQQTFARQLFAGTAADDPDAVDGVGGVTSGADAAAELDWLAGADESLMLVHCWRAIFRFWSCFRRAQRARMAATTIFLIMAAANTVFSTWF